MTAVRRAWASDAAPLLLAAAWVAAVYPFEPLVLSADNLGKLAVTSAPLLVLAVGQLFVLVAGGIDLSVSAVVGLGSVAGALAMTRTGAVPPGLAAGLAVGLAVGALHGGVVAGLRMPPFLVTMATMTALGGAAVWLTGGQPVTGLPSGFVRFCRGSLLGLPFAVWVAAGVCAFAHLLLGRTRLGRQLRAVGYNPATARVSGVPVGRRVVFVYVVSGVCSAIAAALYTAQLGAARPKLLAPENLLDVLGAAVVGGASLRGGRGTVPGVAAGVAFIALVGNGLDLLGLDSWHVVMAKGTLIFLAAAADAARTRGGRS